MLPKQRQEHAHATREKDILFFSNPCNFSRKAYPAGLGASFPLVTIMQFGKSGFEEEQKFLKVFVGNYPTGITGHQSPNSLYSWGVLYYFFI